MPIPRPELASKNTHGSSGVVGGGDGLDDCASEDSVEPPEEILLNVFVEVVWEEGFLGAR